MSKKIQAILVIYPPVEWGGLFQRPHHLATRLARYFYRFFYVQPAGLRNPCISDTKRLLHLFVKRHKDGRTKAQADSGLKVKFLPFLPIHTISMFEILNAYLLDWFLKGIKERYHLPVIFMACAPAPFLKRTRLFEANDIPFVFDWMDDYRLFYHLPEAVSSMQNLLARRADLVLVSSRALGKMAAREGARRISFVPNGVEAAHWDASPHGPPPWKGKGNRPVVGYFGTISHWMDVEVIVDVATKRPKWLFVFIGPRADRGRFDRVFELENCLYIPQMDYHKLPATASHFDVCWMPFLANEQTKAINPVKVYEYLALGKPVVCSAFPDLIDLSDVVHLVEDRNGWGPFLEQAFLEVEDKSLEAKRRKVAKRYDWDRISKEALGSITELVADMEVMS